MVKKAITFVLIRLAFIWLLNVISHFFWCRVAVLTGCFRCFLNWACVQTSITSAPRKSDACETPSVIALLLFHWNSGTTLWLVTWKKKSSICEYWIPAKILCHTVAVCDVVVFRRRRSHRHGRRALAPAIHAATTLTMKSELHCFLFLCMSCGSVPIVMVLRMMARRSSDISIVSSV